VTPQHVIPAGNTLGEGVQWHAGNGLWWTDIHQSRLLRLPVGSERIEILSMPARVGSFALIEGDDRHLLCAFETGVGIVGVDGGATHWLARPEAGGSGRRFNDGRADRQGRFWTGTMVEDEALAAPASASLYCLDHAGELERRHSGIGISNGISWSPDGTRMYFADSPKRTIVAFDFDTERGTIGDPQLFATTPHGAFPDGATVDADGCLWSAQWGASRIVRYRPDGTIDQIIELPVSQPTCVAFGGNRLDELYVTSARDGLDATALASQPLAGHVLVYRPGAVGLPEPRYRIGVVGRR
jgi:sugar lactone lactonase YvrE